MFFSQVKKRARYKEQVSARMSDSEKEIERLMEPEANKKDNQIPAEKNIRMEREIFLCRRTGWVTFNFMFSAFQTSSPSPPVSAFSFSVSFLVCIFF